ncbi:MAG: YbjN domain-containing protein [Methylobacteriaceae bacterium]|jgi:hypothetical protein|nr:YbjN domain-containing protein [Methylobacteriaceae bacterium]
MPLLNVETSSQRAEHPLDVVERTAFLNDWRFDRLDLDEMSVTVAGRWAAYQVSFTWLEEVEAIHIGCAFDLRMREARLTEVLRLLSLVNQQLLVGHFDFWPSENIVVFRHALILADGAEPNPGQCETLLQAAVETCERYFQALQFVTWSDKSAREALDYVLFETEGTA